MSDGEFIEVKLFDGDGRLLAQYVKLPAERLQIPVQLHPTAKRYKMIWASGHVIEGTLIPVYEF